MPGHGRRAAVGLRYPLSVVIDVHEYALVPRRRLNARAIEGARRGALIRVDGGFADIHPWPELGDAKLEEQLALLARGETTALTRRSLAFARMDAEARREGRSLFEGLQIPESHWLLFGDDVPPAFDTVKVKMPCALDRSLARYRLRLDFNAALTAEEFGRFLDALDPDLNIEFVEDPCPYDPRTWRELRKRVRLAADRERGEEADVLVIKPAVDDVPHDPREIVVTSYMDHPVGQLFAAYVAAEECGRLVRTSDPTSGRDVRSPRLSDRCGLLTHLVYEPNAFSERLRIDGTRLVPPGGTGIGFDDLLGNLPWRTLA